MSLSRKFIISLVISIIFIAWINVIAFYVFYSSYVSNYFAEKIKLRDKITIEYINNVIEKQTIDDIDSIFTDTEIEFFELITQEIAKPDSANKYTITNIVFDFYKQKGYKSIIYPGVRSKYRGNNIAMLPEITDKNWTCCFGAEFKLTQTGDDIKIDAIYKINLKQYKLIYSKFGNSEIGEETNIEK